MAAGLDSMLVLTGAHGPTDLVDAGADSRPTHLGYDLRDLLQPVRACVERPGEVSCGEQTAVLDSGRIELVGGPDDRSSAVDALWATANLAWRVADLGRVADAAPAVRVISAVLARR